jgi:hypothetical protein
MEEFSGLATISCCMHVEKGRIDARISEFYRRLEELATDAGSRKRAYSASYEPETYTAGTSSSTSASAAADGYDRDRKIVRRN